MLKDFYCHNCNSLFHEISSEWNGRQIKCSVCGHSFIVDASIDVETEKGQSEVKESIFCSVYAILLIAVIFLLIARKIVLDVTNPWTRALLNMILMLTAAIITVGCFAVIKKRVERKNRRKDISSARK